MFSELKAGKLPDFKKHLNQYDVIHLDIQWCMMDAGSAETTVKYINEHLIAELQEIYPEISLSKVNTAYGALSNIYAATGNKLQDVLIEYGQDERKFSCILQKKAVSEPEKLFDSERFEHMLKELSGSFDYVILDTAPIGIVRDAEIIAGYADSVFMVMKQDEVHAASVNDVIDILEDAGSVVVGGVLNMAKGEKIAGNGYHKYKYGSYYYGYAYGKDGQHAGK